MDKSDRAWRRTQEIPCHRECAADSGIGQTRRLLAEGACQRVSWPECLAQGGWIADVVLLAWLQLDGHAYRAERNRHAVRAEADGVAPERKPHPRIPRGQ